MPNMYVATLRAIYSADDDVEAALIAEAIRENGSVDLDDEDDESEVFVTQVTSNSLEVSFEESLALFRRTRNLLIKTRIKQCFELAKQLDQMIWVLEHRREPGFDLAGYDYTKFFELSEQILEAGESPIV
jgi:hypothetical protein